MFLARIHGSGRKFCGAPKRQGSSEGEKANAPEAGPQGPGGEVGGRDAIFPQPASATVDSRTRKRVLLNGYYSRQISIRLSVYMFI